jgi:mannose-1-phosphate guanylyltransferase / mannose-6-phosphate isomerase
VEKPDLKTAQTYLAAGRYLWNSGMFCATAACFLEQFGQHAPLIVERASLAWRDGKRQTSGTEAALSFGEALFTDIPSDSIDYAVMEKTSRAAVVACNLGWSDVGSWEAVSELTAADAQGNRALGQARLHDCKNTFVWSDGRIAAAVGVENLVIVDTPDALLVAHRDQAQDVKHIFNALKAENHETHRLHQTVFRPWGSYTVLEDRPGYKVKRIEVKPGAALSLQMHHHRSEHWIVGQGSAEVVNGDALLQLSANQSTYIPAGAKHRLTNTGKDLLVLLEVQIGSYLGEDDIVRFEDRYGRA